MTKYNRIQNNQKFFKKCVDKSEPDAYNKNMNREIQDTQILLHSVNRANIAGEKERQVYSKGIVN